MSANMVLWGLWLLFGARVIGQAIQLDKPVEWLPAFAAWQGGTIPYALLLAIQMSLLALMAYALRPTVHKGLSPRLAHALRVAGLTYGLAMSARLALGQTIAIPSDWFARPLPALFHLGLAGWILLYAHSASRAATRRKRWLWRAWLWPAGTVVGLGLYAVLERLGLPLIGATLLPIMTVAIACSMLERRLPYRRAWLPNRSEIVQDFTYMALIQVGLSQALGLAAVIYCAPYLESRGLTLGSFWPHHWPWVIQFTLLALTTDLLHYAFHRGAHRWPWLWSLHRTHHAPDKLYGLNVGRSHPIERVLQWTLEVLPFALLQVNPVLVGAFYVLQSINATLIHSNLRIVHRGPAALFISARHHRWHHSIDPAESTTNFANLFVLWDWAFGTLRLPAGRRPERLGVEGFAYPQPLLREWLAPLNAALQSVLRPVVLSLAAAWIAVRHALPLSIAAAFPRWSQGRVLRRILRAQRSTAFGSEHGFAQIRSFADWHKRVPLHDYESLRSRVELQARTRAQALTVAQPDFYNVTSGTTGLQKFIPMTRTGLAQWRVSQRLMFLLHYLRCPAAFSGKALGIVGAALEGHLDSGQACGSVSGLLYSIMPAGVRSRYIVPAEVFSISKPEIKYRVILRLALQERELRYLVTANPSTLVLLDDLLKAEAALLADSLESGTLSGLAHLDPDQQAAIIRCLRPDAGRARELRRLAKQDRLSLRNVWPELRLVATWTGGSCGMALRALHRRLPESTRRSEIGFMASEGRFTLPWSPENNGGLPCLTQHFFEFLDIALGSEQRPRLLHELEVGKRYELVVTTIDGLYRYRMNDIVEVTGRFLATPLLRFLHKGHGVTNLTGEKLSEDQVLAALRMLEARHGRALRFGFALADEAIMAYRVYLEWDGEAPADALRIGKLLDKALSHLNWEYRAKRTSRRLRTPIVECLPRGAAERWRTHWTAKGQREGQFKPRVLLRADQCDFPLHENVEAA